MLRKRHWQPTHIYLFSNVLSIFIFAYHMWKIIFIVIYACMHASKAHKIHVCTCMHPYYVHIQDILISVYLYHATSTSQRGWSPLRIHDTRWYINKIHTSFISIKALYIGYRICTNENFSYWIAGYKTIYQDMSSISGFHIVMTDLPKWYIGWNIICSSWYFRTVLSIYAPSYVCYSWKCKMAQQLCRNKYFPVLFDMKIRISS